MRDRARRASRSSPVSETRLEQWRSAEQRRRAVESSRQREALNLERQLAPQTPEERETQLTQYRLNQESRLDLRRQQLVYKTCALVSRSGLPPRQPRRQQLVYKTCALVSRSGLPPRQPRRQQLVYKTCALVSRSGLPLTVQ